MGGHAAIQWQRVAMKVLFAKAVDQDGDPVDPSAEEDFLRECAILQHVDSPFLLKMIGFGTSESGSRFIITELMVGGSLSDLLHDQSRDLPWQSRINIGLQVARGMQYLHAKFMLHRDLKSANVLLDEHLGAKVCDFGLARMSRPPPRMRNQLRRGPRVPALRPGSAVRPAAAATGPRLMQVPDCDCPQIKHVEPMKEPSASDSFVHENYGYPPPQSESEALHGYHLTKAVGTMVFMAPEIFRGDQNYTRAVDVYSFGIMLWELATRMTPWHELPWGDRMEFFAALDHALQTGQRPAIPPNVALAHPEFVGVMQHCWTGNPRDRPTFSVAASRLEKCLSSIVNDE